MKNNISGMTSFKWYTEFVRKHAEGIRSVDVNVNAIFTISLNMAFRKNIFLLLLFLP